MIHDLYFVYVVVAFFTLSQRAQYNYINPYSSLPLVCNKYTFFFLYETSCIHRVWFQSDRQTSFKFSMKNPPPTTLTCFYLWAFMIIINSLSPFLKLLLVVTSTKIKNIWKWYLKKQSLKVCAQINGNWFQMQTSRPWIFLPWISTLFLKSIMTLVLD